MAVLLCLPLSRKENRIFPLSPPAVAADTYIFPAAEGGFQLQPATPYRARYSGYNISRIAVHHLAHRLLGCHTGPHASRLPYRQPGTKPLPQAVAGRGYLNFYCCWIRCKSCSNCWIWRSNAAMFCCSTCC